MGRDVPTELRNAEIAPSSLTRELKGHVWDNQRGMHWVPTYCASCSTAGPLVPEPMIADGTGWVCWLCEPCAKKWAPVTALQLIPDEVFWNKVRAAMNEHYGRDLTNAEIETELGDPNSLLSKLARERPKRGTL